MDHLNSVRYWWMQMRERLRLQLDDCCFVLFQTLNGTELEWFPWQRKSAIIQFQPHVLLASWSLFLSIPPLFISSPLSSGLNGVDRSLNSSFVGGGWMNKILFFSGRGEGWLQTNSGEIKTHKCNTLEYFTHSFETKSRQLYQHFNC